MQSSERSAGVERLERTKRRRGRADGDNAEGRRERRPIVVSGEHMPVRSDIVAEYKVALGIPAGPSIAVGR